MSEPIRVFVRTRPSANFASDFLRLSPLQGEISVHLPKQPGQAVNNQQENRDFKFDEILHNTNQEDVYDKVAKDLVRGVVEGFSGSIIAYGQTGAGVREKYFIK